MLGLGKEPRYEKYHRVLSRARWSGLQGAKILLGLLVALVPPSWPLMGGDETIEHRAGRKIKAKGRYRHAVRSTQKVAGCFWKALVPGKACWYWTIRGRSYTEEDAVNQNIGDC